MLNSKRLATALLVIGLASFAGGALATTPHSDDGHGAGLQELRLDQGKRWPTDEPLRQGMSDIRAAMATAFPQIHVGQFTSAQYGALAAKLQERVDHIVGNCRLPEEADAQLHVVLMEIVDGTEAMRSGSDRLGGAMRVIQAIEAYGRHFDHPDWGTSQALDLQRRAMREPIRDSGAASMRIVSARGRRPAHAPCDAADAKQIGEMNARSPIQGG